MAVFSKENTIVNLKKQVIQQKTNGNNENNVITVNICNTGFIFPNTDSIFLTFWSAHILFYYQPFLCLLRVPLGVGYQLDFTGFFNLLVGTHFVLLPAFSLRLLRVPLGVDYQLDFTGFFNLFVGTHFVLLPAFFLCLLRVPLGVGYQLDDSIYPLILSAKFFITDS